MTLVVLFPQDLAPSAPCFIRIYSFTLYFACRFSNKDLESAAASRIYLYILFDRQSQLALLTQSALQSSLGYNDQAKLPGLPLRWSRR
jgi:hypothetical protein